MEPSNTLRSSASATSRKMAPPVDGPQLNRQSAGSPSRTPKNPARPKLTSSNSDIGSPPDHYAPAILLRLHPVLQWIMYLSKRFLQVAPLAKAMFYFVLVIICSSLSSIVEPLRSFYFFRKDSFTNQWFVKWSWGWTFWLLLAFFALAGYLESEGRIDKVKRNVARLLVGTATWYTVTSVFMGGIERRTGHCSKLDYHSQKECLAAGSEWSYFDISGHAFLLIYCSLLILEESRAFFQWEKADRLEGDDAGHFDNVIKPRVLIAMRVLAVALALLAMLWDGMLVVTLIYYHNFLQRFLGVFMGVGAWFLTYKVWYPRYWPGLPLDVVPVGNQPVE